MDQLLSYVSVLQRISDKQINTTCAKSRYCQEPYTGIVLGNLLSNAIQLSCSLGSHSYGQCYWNDFIFSSWFGEKYYLTKSQYPILRRKVALQRQKFIVELLACFALGARWTILVMEALLHNPSWKDFKPSYNRSWLLWMKCTLFWMGMPFKRLGSQTYHVRSLQVVTPCNWENLAK